jgi:hypothetical protein
MINLLIKSKFEFCMVNFFGEIQRLHLEVFENISGLFNQHRLRPISTFLVADKTLNK